MQESRTKFRNGSGIRTLNSLGRIVARYLERPVQGYEPFPPSDPAVLRNSLQPGDVLLVDGNSRVSGVIKYLTQSTWSHAALYVGPILGTDTDCGEPHVLIEAELGEGVVSSALSKYYLFHTRICRPVGLGQDECESVCRYAIERIGFDYDLRNIIDLMRYLIPVPVPQRWRRRMMALGSGNPTRIICSALIAQAFEVVRYPILPKITRLESAAAGREILQTRHSSLCAPRDFDISPYFQIVKPTLVKNFNYKIIDWADLPTSPQTGPKANVAHTGGPDQESATPAPARGPTLRHGTSIALSCSAAASARPALSPSGAWSLRSCANNCIGLPAACSESSTREGALKSSHLLRSRLLQQNQENPGGRKPRNKVLASPV
jgi:hypothetical protein